MRSTLAAEGSDKVVDACMKEMRDVIRSDNMDAGLAGLIPRLEKAVLDSEQRRETRMNQVSDALTALVGQLQGLPLPSDISRPLKKTGEEARRRGCPVTRAAAAVGRVERLAGRALSALGKPGEEARPGFLQRLFGSREEDAQAGAELAPVALPAAEVVPQAAGSAEPSRPDDVDALQPLPAPAAPTARWPKRPSLSWRHLAQR